MNHNPEEPEAVGQVGQWDTPIQYNGLDGSKGAFGGGTVVGHGGTLPIRPAPLPADPSALPTEVVARLVDDYRTASAEWARSPRIAETARRLRKAKTWLERREVLGDLRRSDLRCIGLAETEAADMLTTLDQLMGKIDAAADFVAGHASRGGARRLAALYGNPPRVDLALSVLSELLTIGCQPSNRQLVAAVEHVLSLAGDPEPTGIDDLVRALPRPRENQRLNAAGSPLHHLARPCLPARTKEGCCDGDRHRHSSDSIEPLQAVVAPDDDCARDGAGLA